ncbi:hypothetical protein P1J78_24080 [Psychromarinibacter sp. C21-152]|uniref:Uncharacterized protein n=1 Tax=Psychromarinibacter sediminicola TaxID=3033385 RepID=A0AAE3NT28_9RHOB|nr:hypothetical protein [Psychromarinibacter sediminicola]MDF0603798.1 hypothetical protein [Psychromarinibacter sediminicola]
MHPADELARIRQEIATLKAREKALREEFLDGRAPLRSNAHEVRIVNKTRRVFCRDRLPLHVRADPALWRDSPMTQVRVVPAAGLAEAADGG